MSVVASHGHHVSDGKQNFPEKNNHNYQTLHYCYCCEPEFSLEGLQHRVGGETAHI